MGTRGIPSSRAFGREAVVRLTKRNFQPRRVLVAGLGMGATLASVLDFDFIERVDVVEIDEKVVAWNRTLFRKINKKSLDDARVRLIQGDLVKLLEQLPQNYDLILLDVDNGPSMVSRKENIYLYQNQGIKKLKNMLAGAGLVATWSSIPDRQYLRRQARIFEEVVELKVKRKTSSPDYFYFAYAFLEKSRGWLVNTWCDEISI